MSRRRSFRAAHLAFEKKLGRLGMVLLKESVQELAEVANRPIAQGGRMPVDLGHLRASFVASTSGPPNVASGPLELVLVSWRQGETIWMGWTADYALRQEYGFFGPDKLGRVYSQQGKAFMRTAAQQWPQIVDKATARVQRAAAGTTL